MKTSVAWLSAVLFALAMVVGCGDTPGKGHQHIHLCTKCGFVEDSDKCGDNCCKVGVKCEKCGFIKGSPACCNAEIVKLVKADKDAHIVICEKCGNLDEENEACCKKAGAKICAKCKHHEGSLLCIQECGPKKETVTKEPEKKEPEKKKEAEKKGPEKKDTNKDTNKDTEKKDTEKTAPPKREPGKEPENK